MLQTLNLRSVPGGARGKEVSVLARFTARIDSWRETLTIRYRYQRM
jgi:hypothetical protein